MKNAKNTKTAKIENDKSIVIATSTKTPNALCVADVARELDIDAKRARAYLRKHVELYVARHQRFTRDSSLFTATYNALSAYKNAKRVITD